MIAQPTSIETTVTYLELVPPGPRRESLPTGQNIALMRAEKPSLHFYRYLMFRTGKPWNWVYRLRLPDAELEEIIHAETTDIHVLYVDGGPAGFFEIDRSVAGETNIAYFGLMMHAAGRGLGRWFLSEAIHSALLNNPEKVTVNTCTLDHKAALPLYQKMGFFPTGREDVLIRPLDQSELLSLSVRD
ncbi:MAG: GNAT family N-acetyltransferase [Notoacmeibacter sp.]